MTDLSMREHKRSKTTGNDRGSPDPSVHLYPKPPYNFPVSAFIFSHGDPAIRCYKNGIFRQALEVDGMPILVSVHSPGTTDAPELVCSVESDRTVRKSVRSSAGDHIAAMFNIYEDLVPFYREIEHDPILMGLLPGLYGLKSPATPTVFEALIDSVIEQQISLSVAHTLQNRMIKTLGQSVSSRDLVYYCYPAPARLADTPVELFRSLGMTMRKGEYIREISRQVVDGSFDCEGLKTLSDTAQIIRELVKIRGIGQWTAELTILRGMHRLDAFPADDVGTRRIIAQYYHNDNRMTADEARAFAEQWGKWKGLVAYYLEVADMSGIQPGTPGKGREYILF
jgi:DNA-3-methyladenine glycosylase II